MPWQCRSARTIAEWLVPHPAIERVHYPGLPSHPGRGVAARLLRDSLAGAVVSFELRGAGRPEVFAFMDALRLCCTGTTVGDIYSQLLYPAISSHRALSPEERRRSASATTSCACRWGSRSPTTSSRISSMRSTPGPAESPPRR